MRRLSVPGFTRSLLVAAFVSVAAVGSVFDGDRVAAQILPGEYHLHQPGTADPVGWAWRSGDGATEWWAYVDGSYSWAGSANGPSSRWRLDAEYVGAGNWANYAAWKNHVLLQSAAQGRTIVFQDHSICEETLSN